MVLSLASQSCSVFSVLFTVTIRFNEFKTNKLHVSSAVIVTQKMFGYYGGLRVVGLLVSPVELNV